MNNKMNRYQIETNIRTFVNVRSNCVVFHPSNNSWDRYCPLSNIVCNQFCFQFIYVEHIFTTSLNKQSVMKFNLRHFVSLLVLLLLLLLFLPSLYRTACTLCSFIPFLFLYQLIELNWILFQCLIKSCETNSMAKHHSKYPWKHIIFFT